MRNLIILVLALSTAACGLEADETSEGDVESRTGSLIWNNLLLEYSALSTDRKLLANSTAILMERADVTQCNSSFCVLTTTDPPMCPGQRFATQRGIHKACTAFMVGPRQFATASHCFSAPAFGACANTSVAFRWRKDSTADANPNVLLEHIYNCQNIVFDGASDGQDWVIFEVDRDVTSSTATPRGPLALARTRPAVGTPFESPQHFAGLPMKYGSSTISDAPNDLSNIQARIDVTGGSSGSPWIERSNDRVMGVLSIGPPEDQSAPCIKEKDCLNQVCSAAEHRPAAAPAWHMPKGPRNFVTTFSFTRPADTAIVGDFDGDGSSDIYWYQPGSTPEVVWFGGGDRSFAVTDPGATSGTYVTRSGDFDGDGRSDVLWYRAGEGDDFVEYGNADRTFTTTTRDVNGTYVPLIGDFNGDGRDDVFWYRAGSATDSVWYGNADRTFTSVAATNVTATFTPIVGDFDGDRRSDIYWYAAGSTAEQVWYGNSNRTFTQVTPGAVNGTYVIRVGDFDGDGRSDLLWYRPGTGDDFLDHGNAARTFSRLNLSAVSGTYTPVVGDFDGDSKDGIFWHQAADSSLSAWWGNAIRNFAKTTETVPGSDLPLGVGDFDDDGLADILVQLGPDVFPLWGQRFTD